MSDNTLRKQLLHVAHSLPQGSEERKRVLALLKESMEHDSPEALKQYLKDHPDADKSKHTVKKDDGGEKKDEGKKEISKEQATAAKGLKDALGSGHAKRIKPEVREKLTKAIEQMESTGSPPDDIRKTFREALDSLLPARKIPAVKEFMTSLKSQFKALDVPKAEPSKPKPDISKYKGQRGIIAPPNRGGVGKPYRRRASNLKRDALRIASTLPKGDPVRRKLLAVLQRAAGKLDRVDSYSLFQFGEEVSSLGRNAWRDLGSLMTGGSLYSDGDSMAEEVFESTDPRFVDRLKKEKITRFHADIQNAVDSYEAWSLGRLASTKKTARGSLDCADSYDLLEFSRAFANLGGAVQEQLADLMTLDPRQWAGINPNAVKMIQRARLGKFHDDFEDVVQSYFEWLEG